MALVPVSSRNRVNPVVSFFPTTIDQYEVCTDPNCKVCRGGGRHRHHKHHHRKHRDRYWDDVETRIESPASTVSIHSIGIDDRRHSITERQLISSSKNKRLPEERIVRDAWTRNRTTPDNDIVCCRAYDGCRCPCWCCIIFIILIVILIIILIVLLATLL